MSSSSRRTGIDITFTDKTTRSTYRSVIHEIRRKFGVQVVYFDNDDLPGKFYASFEGPINPDHATSLYSELSKKAHKYIESMNVRPSEVRFAGSNDGHMATIDITCTNGTTRSTFDAVVREITRKFGVQVTYLNNDGLLSGFCASFEGPISADEAFLLYSRKLSNRALRSLKMSSERLERPARSLLWASFLSHHDEVRVPGGGLADFDFSNEETMEQVQALLARWFAQSAYRGFRIDAVPDLSDGYPDLMPGYGNDTQ